MIKHVNKFTSMNWFTVLVVFCLAVVQPCLTTSCEETASTTGTHFMFGVPNKKSYAGNSSGLIHFTPQSSTGARVTITIPFINFHHQFTVYDTLTLPLPYSLRQTEFGLKSKGVEIVSDTIISVTVELNYESTNSEGFLVLPTSALSTRYIAASYYPWIANHGIFPNSILIVGIENDTYAQINYTENGERVVKATGRLQKFDTYQLLVYFEDVSGAVITSNKPVAVIASSYYSQIPVNCSFNFIVEQMVPTKFWTNKYIVPPIYYHTLNIVRVFADHENTVLNYFNHTHHMTDNLSRGEMKEILFGADPVVIIADKPIGVIQYAAPACNNTLPWWYRVDQPLMMTSQGMSQYTDTYYFFNPQPSREYYYRDEPNYLVITIQRNKTSGLDLNGNTFYYWNLTTVPVSSPLADYVTLYVNISHNSSFQLHHIQGVKFGAFIYGFAYDVSFGYPLQLALSSNECQSQPDFSLITTETPAPVTSSGDTTQRPGSGLHTTVSTQHLLQQTTFPGLMFSSTSSSQTITGNNTWCFACNGIMHLKYCDTVKPCNTETEVCHVTRYAKSSSVQVYSTGCMEKDMCTVAGPSVDCQTCCAGSFCNTVGCGDTGLPDRSDRGPMCFDCDHLGENDQCQTVQMCAPGQVCKIEKYVWGKEFNYVMGCSDQRLCLSKRYLTSPEKRHSPNMTPLEKRSIKVKTPEERSTPVCLRCCNDDFCNMNCTSIHQAQFIG